MQFKIRKSFIISLFIAILAFQKHRSAFYRKQLIAALTILDAKKIIPQELKSTFDGGMGQPQFEPSVYLQYAVDFDGDGFKDIWTSMPDAFASIANYLMKNGWQPGQPWGFKIKLPSHFPAQLTGRANKHPIKVWQDLGVTLTNGEPLPNLHGNTAVLLPSGANGTAYIVCCNFYALMNWNNTTFESLVVGLLADSLVEQPQAQSAAIASTEK
jgi:membrane-bound lytic murein transglycosylase B